MPPARLPQACSRLTTPLRPQHHHHPQVNHSHSPFTTAPILSKKNTPLPPRPSVPESETFKKFLKGSGPGGQKINKTNSAVQLTHIPTGMVVKSQATRSRTQNEVIARRIMGEKLEWLERGEESRVGRKIERVRRRKGSAGKKKRRKYRKLAEVRQGGEEEDEWADGEEEMEDEGENDRGTAVGGEDTTCAPVEGAKT